MNGILLKNIKESQSFLANYTQGMSFLYQSGLLEFLRDFGRVPVVPSSTPNFKDYQKYVGAWSLGFQEALDHLIYFREMHLDDPSKPLPVMDFGGIDKAVETGDLTKEEADAIRLGKPVPQLSPNTSDK